MDSYFKSAWIVFSIGMLMIACSKEKEDDPIPPMIEGSLTGVAQKGPFLNGSSISIFELDQLFAPTGNSFNTQIIDNSGLFQISNVALATNYVALRVDGFYFNEVCGEMSGSQITLNGIVDISQSDFKNLNVITHLEKARVEFLLTEGLDFASAKSQAQEEVLNIFNISGSIENSEELDISGSSDGDAVLIAVSSILQGYRNESEFSVFLANIITDFRTDGTLDSESLGADLVSHAKLLHAESISENIESRYSDIGVDVTVPEFESIIDNFLQETEFLSDESAIDYPETGNSGSNILNSSLTEVEQFVFYSLAATVPNECLPLRIKISKSSGFTCEGGCWSHGLGLNWSLSNYDFDTDSQIFTTIGLSADVPIIFSQEGVFLIEYFEKDSSEPTSTKVISCI